MSHVDPNKPVRSDPQNVSKHTILWFYRGVYSFYVRSLLLITLLKSFTSFIRVV